MAANVWVAFPTANPPRSRETLAKWRERGYSSIALIDPDQMDLDTGADITVRHIPYQGYYHAQNYLCRRALDQGAIAVVCAGDDMDPDPVADPARVAAECFARSGSSLFVMQPCGDTQGRDSSGRSAAERICGSPWVGPEYIRRGYQGRGPFCEDYHHQFGDEEAKIVAERNGALWMRGDLTQLHRHWSWGHMPKAPYQVAAQKFANQDQKTFIARKAAGFPGSGLAPA